MGLYKGFTSALHQEGTDFIPTLQNLTLDSKKKIEYDIIKPFLCPNAKITNYTIYLVYIQKNTKNQNGEPKEKSSLQPNHRPPHDSNLVLLGHPKHRLATKGRYVFAPLLQVLQPGAHPNPFRLPEELGILRL